MSNTFWLMALGVAVVAVVLIWLGLRRTGAPGRRKKDSSLEERETVPLPRLEDRDTVPLPTTPGSARKALLALNDPGKPYAVAEEGEQIVARLGGQTYALMVTLEGGSHTARLNESGTPAEGAEAVRHDVRRALKSAGWSIREVA